MTATAPRPMADVVRTLRATVLDVLRPILADAGRVALLEYPSYPNPGDGAIWLGALSALDALGIPPPSYATEVRTHRDAELRAALGATGTILLQGGGSFGDVWPELQAFRDGVVAAFPDRPVVQLPQSVQFDHAEAARRTRDVLARHPSYRLLVRDRESVRAAEERLGVPATLCPDLALLLDVPPARADLPDRVLWLARTDREAAGGAAGAAPTTDAGDVRVLDWIDLPRSSAYRRLSRRSRRLRRRARPSPRLRRRLVETFEPLARERLAHALSVLDGGRVVVTDRLHGHVLCLLRGQPHVLLDNRYGKLARFHDAWTAGAAGVTRARTAAEALAQARARLLAGP